MVNDSTLITVPVGVAPPLVPIDASQAVQSDVASDDSNKKQRTNSRSADLAAVVEQPRHSQ
jgi:hypothetical protein